MLYTVKSILAKGCVLTREDPETYQIGTLNQANQNDWPKENQKKLLWNLESQNTAWRTLETVVSSLLRQGARGESVPSKDPDVSERPSITSSTA